MNIWFRTVGNKLILSLCYASEEERVMKRGIEEAVRGRRHIDWFEWGRCAFLIKVDCWH